MCVCVPSAYPGDGAVTSRCPGLLSRGMRASGPSGHPVFDSAVDNINKFVGVRSFLKYADNSAIIETFFDSAVQCAG